MLIIQRLDSRLRTCLSHLFKHTQTDFRNKSSSFVEGWRFAKEVLRMRFLEYLPDAFVCDVCPWSHSHTFFYNTICKTMSGSADVEEQSGLNL